MNKIDLVFATNNTNKVKEIHLLLPNKINILSLKDVNCLIDLPETSDTLEGNAIQKAQYVYDNFNKNCFADDTGLLVESINNEPGVYSARYAGEHKNSNDNMDLLLQNLQNRENRNAKFQTVIALINDGKLTTFFGEVKGKIARKKSGKDGFGYDPIFIPNGLDISFSEMSLLDKNKISHRGIATRKLIEHLNKL